MNGLHDQKSTKGLLTLWTMKLSLAPLKYLIGCYTRFRITLVYIKENNVRVTMKLEVFKRFVMRFTLFIGTV